MESGESTKIEFVECSGTIKQEVLEDGEKDVAASTSGVEAEPSFPIVKAEPLEINETDKSDEEDLPLQEDGPDLGAFLQVDLAEPFKDESSELPGPEEEDALMEEENEEEEEVNEDVSAAGSSLQSTSVQDEEEARLKLELLLEQAGASVNKANKGNGDVKYFECSICQKKYRWKRSLAVHQKVHSENVELKCTECDYKAYTKSRLKDHMRVHREKSFFCVQCDFQTNDKKNLQIHILNIHEKDEGFSCHLCPYKTNYQPCLKKHMKFTHAGVKRKPSENVYRCELCGYESQYKQRLQMHSRKHTGERPFACEQCEYRAADIRAVRSHMARIHKIGTVKYQPQEVTDDKPFECDECPLKFKRKNGLDKHKRVHTGERPFTCDICCQSFSLKAVLIHHIRRQHTKEKPYACDVCPKAFVDSGSLTKHKRVHSGERPYKCEICFQSFNLKTIMVRHIKHRHTKEKAFACDLCTMAFVDRGSLKDHLRRKHKLLVP